MEGNDVGLAEQIPQNTPLADGVLFGTPGRVKDPGPERSQYGRQAPGDPTVSHQPHRPPDSSMHASGTSGRSANPCPIGSDRGTTPNAAGSSASGPAPVQQPLGAGTRMLQTATFGAVAAPTSIVFTPTPIFWTSRSRGADSINAAVIDSSTCHTTSASASASTRPAWTSGATIMTSRSASSVRDPQARLQLRSGGVVVDHLHIFLLPILDPAILSLLPNRIAPVPLRLASGLSGASAKAPAAQALSCHCHVWGHPERASRSAPQLA